MYPILNSGIQKKLTNTVIVTIDPFIPKCSSERGWAMIFPMISAMTKSSNLNCENDRGPIIFVAKSRKVKLITARALH